MIDHSAPRIAMCALWLAGHGYGSLSAARRAGNPQAAHALRHGQSMTRTGPLDTKEKKEWFARNRIVKRGLNLMRSMQQGISTHHNTRFGI